MVVIEETFDIGPPQGKPDKRKETADFVSAKNHPIFKKIEEGCLNDIQNFIDGGVSVEIEDQNGMTPLMHACWKGQENIVSYLLQQEADTNGGNHEHQYTALHFAALAKKPGICTMLMEAGAKKHHTNSVNRTASAMAAFVGNHACVSVINNYVPKDDVYYYSKKQPFEESPKLTVQLAKPLHKLVMSMNSHPVSIAYFFRDEPALLQNISKIRKVLELMSDKEFKNRSDVNEVLSLKYHIMQYIVKDIEKQVSFRVDCKFFRRHSFHENGDFMKCLFGKSSSFLAVIDYIPPRHMMWSMNILLVVFVPAFSLNVKEGDWEVGHCILASMDLQLVVQLKNVSNNIMTFPRKETVTGSCDSETTQEMIVSWNDRFILEDGTTFLGRYVTFQLYSNGSVYGLKSVMVGYQHEDDSWLKFRYEAQGLLLETPINRTYACKDLTRKRHSIQFTDHFGTTLVKQAWIEISKIRLNAFRPEPAGDEFFDSDRTVKMFQSRHKCKPEATPWIIAGALGGIVLAILASFIVKVYM